MEKNNKIWIWIKRNLATILLVLVVVILVNKINDVEERLMDVEVTADRALVGVQAVAGVGDDTSSDMYAEIANLEEKLDDHLDCLELWSIGSGYMNKRDIYFCSSN